MTTAASYERVSTRLQGQTGFSLGAQEKDSAQFAADNRLDLPSELRFRDGEDRAASGSDWDLPGLNAMLDAAKSKRFGVLIVPTVDRFARDMAKALLLEQQLRKLGVRVVYINAPIEDTAEGRLLLRQLQSFAEFEKEKIKFRTSRGRREKIERGQILGSGPAPYGYRYVRVDQGTRKRVVGLEEDPATALIARRIFKEALRRSAEQIVDMLRAEGVTPPPGYNRRTPALRWTRDIVLRILQHPVYVGLMIYGGTDGRRRANLFADGSEGVAVPALIDRRLWDDVQHALQRRQKARRSRSAGEDPWLLRGLLTCAHCRGLLSISHNSIRQTASARAMGLARGSYRQYECLRSHPGSAAREQREVCPLRAVHAEQIEGAVWKSVHDVLMDPVRLQAGMRKARERFDTARERHVDRIATADHEIARYVGQIERLVDELLDTTKGTETYRALVERRTRIEGTIERLRTERARLDVEPNEGISPAAAEQIVDFSRQVASGLTLASVTDRRRVLEDLHVQVTLRMDPDGAQFGRVKRNRYAVELDAIVHLDAGNAAGLPLGKPSISLAIEPWFTVRIHAIPRKRTGILPTLG